MDQRIGIGMSQQTLSVRHFNPTENQLSPRTQRMDVIAAADVHCHRLSLLSARFSFRAFLARLASLIRDVRIASPITRSSGLVTLMFSPLPSTTATECPSHSIRNASSVARIPSSYAFLWAASIQSRLNACGV